MTGQQTTTLSTQSRGTKIVATLGPATDNRESQLIAAGVNVFRLNFSHGAETEHQQRVDRVRKCAAAGARVVAILGDLQGPKIRIHQFSNGAVELLPGASFCIDPSLPASDGDSERVGASYPALAEDCAPGDQLVLGDGLIQLEVASLKGDAVHCIVTTGGTLSGGKGINKMGGGLSAPALTDKDRADIAFAAKLKLDYLAVSFPRSADDLSEARRLALEAGLDCGLVAKMERAEAVANDEVLDQIILASDAVMIARGDLGIEIGYPALMGIQKKVIKRARELNRATITATQMMESMIDNPSPTRAEVLDVANAVLDGTDAVMLSGETAVGRYPVETVKAMVKVISGAEASAQFVPDTSRASNCDAIDEAIAMAVMTVADKLDNVRAIACFTHSGNTPKLMSRMLSRIPIYAMVEGEATLARVALYRGVEPVKVQFNTQDYDRMNDEAVDWLKRNGAIQTGDRVILSKGALKVHREAGSTNTMKIIVA